MFAFRFITCIYYVFLGQSHFHAEHEHGALAFACRVAIDFSARVLNDLLANCETEADSLCVYVKFIWLFIDFAENLEQFFHIFWLDSPSHIHNMHLELLLSPIVARLDAYGLCVGEFERVFDQIDKHLF